MTEHRPGPERMTAVDVALLGANERTAVLVHLAGHADPIVAQAVVEATREVLARTRGGSWADRRPDDHDRA